MLAIILFAFVALMGAGVFAHHAPQYDCDCYVDLHGQYNYIYIWKGYPCSGYNRGALYQGRCLYYAYDSWGNTQQQYADCNGKNHLYYKMRTESGKSKGWVASEYLSCGYGSGGPPPAAAIVAPQQNGQENNGGDGGMDQGNGGMQQGSNGQQDN